MNKNLFTLMYYLFAILIVIACFLAIGYFTKHEILKTSIKIGASPENCYNIYIDPKMIGEWTDNFKALEIVEGEFNQVGAKYKLILDNPEGDDETVIHEEVVEVKPNKKQVLSYTNEFLDGTMTTTFKAEGDSTVLTSVNKFTGKTLLYRSIFHFMKDKVTGNTGEQYQKLKSLIEQKYPIQTLEYEDSSTKVDSTSATVMELDTIQQ